MRICIVKPAVAAVVLAVLSAFHVPAVAANQFAAPPSSSAFSIPTAQLVQPDELNRLLQAKGHDKPLVLQVGSHVMFAQAHIAGAEYAGPGSQDTGLQLLRHRVAQLPRHTFIVIYCGCCPWNRCPNVEPAYMLLQQLGFTRIKVLYLADNFGADWAGKGFPVDSGR